MKLILASVAPRRTKSKLEAADSLLREYLDRAARLMPIDAALYTSEAALLESLDKPGTRTATRLILFDSTGDLVTSTQLAERLGRARDSGLQRMFYAIGPADGWSAEARMRAAETISLGRITLPHELARIVAAEQIYRALTILAGHPYHSGH